MSTPEIAARVAGGPVDPETLLERLLVPGAAVAVLRDGELAWSRGFGRRSAASEDPVRATTRFQAGSISKSVAALCAMRLVARGELELDEDVNATLRAWKVTAAGSWRPRVTLRQLLSHTGGLSLGGYPGYARDRSAPALVEALDGVGGANTPPVRVTALPGLGYAYSGGGFAVLQQLLIDRTGSSFEELTRALVLAPLGMGRSGYEQVLDDAARETSADGHRPDGRPLEGGSFVYPESAAAGMWTTAEDLARFLAALQLALAGEHDAILPSELAAAMVADASGAGYGLGLRLFPSPGGELFGHGGDSQGFIARAVASRDGQRGAIVMTNSDFGGPVIQALFDGIAEAEGWPERAPAGATPLAAGCAGAYRFADGGLAVVRDEGGKVVLELPGQPPLLLSPTTHGTWKNEVLNMHLEFDAGRDGPSPEITLWQRPDQADPARFRAQRVADDGGER